MGKMRQSNKFGRAAGRRVAHNESAVRCGPMSSLRWASLILVALALAGTFLYLSPAAFFRTQMLAGLEKAEQWHRQGERRIDTALTDEDWDMLRNRLRDLAAGAQEARNSAERLTITAIRFDRLRLERMDEWPEDIAKPYPVTLDLAGANRWAGVILTDQSIAWQMAPPARIGRALLALEGRGYPQFKGLAPGVLAGFRLPGSLSSVLGSAVDLEEATPQQRRETCESIRQWSRHFGVDIERVRYQLIDDPTSITADGSGWRSDGRNRGWWEGGELRAVCAKHLW